MISRKKVEAPKRKRGRPKGSTRREGAHKKVRLAAQDEKKPDKKGIDASLEANTDMSVNQEVGKLLSDGVVNQTNMMPNTGSPVDVDDPVQPANPVDDGKEQVAASTLLMVDPTMMFKNYLHSTLCLRRVQLNMNMKIHL